jgi:hypothetical protein
MPKNSNSQEALKNSLLRNAIEKIRRDAVDRTKGASKLNKRSS